MNIFIDVRLCSYGYQGVKTYIEGILPYFLKTEHKFFLAGFPDFINKFSDYKNVETIRFKSKLQTFNEQIEAIKIKKHLENKVDVYFFPYPSVPAIFWSSNFVVKLHDVTPFKFPTFYNFFKVKIGYFVIKAISNKARKIIAVSVSTKNDLCSFLKIPPQKIEVIYDGISDTFKMLDKEVVQEFKLKNNLKKFILYVGNREKTKNIFTLIDAVKILRKKMDIELIIIGRKFKLYEKIDNEILKCGSWIKIKYDVDVNTLVYYYNSCEVFVLPSLNEGFGLPVIEAMRCGCPVVVSDIEVFKEITDGAALYFNPYSVTSLVEKLQSILYSENLKKNISLSLEKSRKYSWEKTAEMTLKVLLQ